LAAVTLTRKTKKNPIKLQKFQQKYSVAKAFTVCSALWYHKQVKQVRCVLLIKNRLAPMQ